MPHPSFTALVLLAPLVPTSAVQRLRSMAADEREHDDGPGVPEREPHAHVVRAPPPPHGSPAQSTNPTRLAV